MAAAAAILVVLAMAALCLLGHNANAATLALYNRCTERVWPGIQPSAGQLLLARGGMQLLPNLQGTSVRLPARWSGHVWGRQGCSFDANGHCATGDCELASIPKACMQTRRGELGTCSCGDIATSMEWPPPPHATS